MTETFRPFDYQIPMVEHLLANDRAALELLVLLDLSRDVCGKDGLQPLSGAAADDPSVCGGYRASKAGGELRGSKGKAFVPGHAWRVTRKNKNAMRKNKACVPICNAYSLRMSNTNKTAAERTAKYFGISIEKATEMLAAADKMNAQVRAKGEALAQRVKEGKRIPYVTR